MQKGDAMRNVYVFLVILALFAVPASGQQAPSTQDGPLNINPAAPTPDSDGVYEIGPGITAPAIVNPEPVRGSEDEIASCTPHMVRITAVIGADGVMKIRDLGPSGGGLCENLALAAVKRSLFQAGALDGKPVPVLVCIRVPFLRVQPPIPRIVPCSAGFGRRSAAELEPSIITRAAHSSKADLSVPLCPAKFNDGLEIDGIAARNEEGLTHPIPRYQPEAEMSDEARRSNGETDFVVVLSFVVDADGQTKDVCLIRSAGYGLDANAANTTERYKFDPATKDGKPVPMRIRMEVSFRKF